MFLYVSQFPHVFTVFLGVSWVFFPPDPMAPGAPAQADLRPIRRHLRPGVLGQLGEPGLRRRRGDGEGIMKWRTWHTHTDNHIEI